MKLDEITESDGRNNNRKSGTTLNHTTPETHTHTHTLTRPVSGEGKNKRRSSGPFTKFQWKVEFKKIPHFGVGYCGERSSEEFRLFFPFFQPLQCDTSGLLTTVGGGGGRGGRGSWSVALTHIVSQFGIYSSGAEGGDWDPAQRCVGQGIWSAKTKNQFNIKTQLIIFLKQSLHRTFIIIES